MITCKATLPHSDFLEVSSAWRGTADADESTLLSQPGSLEWVSPIGSNE